MPEAPDHRAIPMAGEPRLPLRHRACSRREGYVVTFTVKLFVAATPLESATLAVKVYVPTVVGLPERTPVVLRVRPGGSVPADRDHV